MLALQAARWPLEHVWECTLSPCPNVTPAAWLAASMPMEPEKAEGLAAGASRRHNLWATSLALEHPGVRQINKPHGEGGTTTAASTANVIMT